MRRISAVAPRVAALSLLMMSLSTTASASTPPDESSPDDSALDDDTVGNPPIGPNSPDFERQLAEIDFRTLMADTDAAAAGAVACSEPDDTADGEIICFHVLDDVVTVATTTASDGTGEFEFEIVSSAGVPVVDAEARAAADELIAAEAGRINNNAPGFVAQYEQDASIESVERYEFDTDASMLVIEFTLADDVGFALGDVAWANTREFARFYWAAEGSFRSADATDPPGLRVTINGETWESDHELMVLVADETIARDAWLDLFAGTPVDSTP